MRFRRDNTSEQSKGFEGEGLEDSGWLGRRKRRKRVEQEGGGGAGGKSEEGGKGGSVGKTREVKE